MFVQRFGETSQRCRETSTRREGYCLFLMIREQILDSIHALNADADDGFITINISYMPAKYDGEVYLMFLQLAVRFFKCMLPMYCPSLALYRFFA